MTIGEWIKKQRLAAGWSQAQLAARLGINRSAVAQWEAGTTKPHRLRSTSVGITFGDNVPEKIVKATWG